MLPLLGKLRPVRLLAKFRKSLLEGQFPSKSKVPATIKKIERMVPGPVIGITTDTKTLITEGLVSHNSSLSAMYVCSQRLIKRGQEHEQTIIIYCGDHDPSGEDMVRDVEDRLVTFGVRNLEVRKCCLTMQQIRRHRLPPNPARPPPPVGAGSKKGTDSRAHGYIEEHGTDSWEVEALKPAQIRQYIEAPFKDDDLIDMELMQPILDREEEQRTRLQEAIDKMLEELGDDND